MYLLLGYGLANQAIAQYFNKNSIKYLIYDDYSLHYKQKIDLENIKIVVKSPGIKNDHHLIIAAKEMNLIIVTDIELFFHFFPNKNYITITGSNGKTTTISLTDKILQAGMKNYLLAGNVGIPVFKYAGENGNLLIEASSFMLEHIKNFKSQIACILNITIAHLDFHETFENYLLAKQNILKNQTENDFLVYNIDDEIVNDFTKLTPAIKVPFSKTKIVDGAYLLNRHLYFKDEYITSLDEISLIGMHNIENILASIAIAKILKINAATIRLTIKEFLGIEHRIEYVGELNGISVYNDSKSTNLFALKNAIASFKNQQILLICGGKYRMDNFQILDKVISNINKVLIFGENKDIFANYFNTHNIACEIFSDLDLIMQYLQQNKIVADVILFSPGSSSQDQFKNYEERGRKFKSYVI